MLPYNVSISYMIAGYAVIFVILALYIISLLTRWKALQRDLQILQENDEK